MIGTLSSDGKRTLGKDERFTLGDDGVADVGLLRFSGSTASEEAVDCVFLMKIYDNCFKATAVSFLSLKRGDAEGDCKTSTSFFQLRVLYHACLVVDISLCAERNMLF